MKDNIFKNHILIEKHLKDGNYNLDVWDFKHPNSEWMHRIKFINSCGVLTVTGDFGNWIFCREFHPSKEGEVSRSYWDEKLRISSEQKSHEFDSEETLEEIKRLREDIKEWNEDNSEAFSWLDDLESYVYDKFEYEHLAYRECPINLDFDYIPYGKKRHVWLDMVYDAFNEICNRYKNN